MTLNNKHHLNIGVRIAVGFMLAIFLMLALTYVSLNHMGQSEARLKNIVEKNNVKTDMAQIMQRALRERALSMHIMAVLKDDFLKDAEYQRFSAFGGEYIRARETLESLAISPQEKSVLSKIIVLTREAQPEVEEVMNMGLQDFHSDIFDQIRMQAMPKQKLIGQQVDKLIDLQRIQTATAVKEAESSYASARQTTLFLGGFASLLTVFIAVFVSMRVSRQARILEYQALHDELTGLPNRTLYQDRLKQEIKHALREGTTFAVILMDLDRFKEVNDTLGHNIGDLLLQDVGRRLKETVRTIDTVAWLGGDEYVIILDNVSESQIQHIIEKILKTLELPFSLDGEVIDISASIGIALFPDHGEDAITLTQRADVAMYAAKHANSGYAIYSESQEHGTRADLTLKSELRQAIAQEELVLYYQPKINHQTRCIMGVEALVRWQHPKRGFLPPDQFILAAEQNGLIQSLTTWVLKKALNQCAEFHKAGIFISVTVNLSARSLHDKHLPSEIADLLDKANVAPSYLVLEITESVVMADQTSALVILNQLDKMGVTLAIDDFGTGYSSLASLSKLPVDEIKIDKSFVLDMMSDKQASVIVRSTIDLGHNLGLKVVAEGVETAQVWDTLTEWGCDTAQGYYMSKPLPANDLIQWIRESAWAEASPINQKHADNTK